MARWKLKMGIGVTAIAAAVAGMFVVAPVGTAQEAPAGTAQEVNACPIEGCSHVTNLDNLPITARHDWTCDWGTTGSSSTGCVGGGTYFLVSGASTPSSEDWDVVRVDAGWCYRIQFINWWGKVWTERYDRRGQSHLYVKVEGSSWGRVTDQSTSSCP